jgi:alkylation response protein AidB-like acyl-CoA dehydrogenase
VVNGQKIWTSYAHHADWMFCLVRTAREERPQQGISFLLIDMKSPGVTVKPILMLEGTHSFNAVFFDNVRVPKDNRIGEEGRGWTYAKFLLEHERVDNAAIGVTKQALNHVKAIAEAERDGDTPLIDDPLFQAKLIAVEAQLMSLEMAALRVLSEAASGASPGPVSSLLKIRGTEVAQRISELGMEATAYYALPYQPGLIAGQSNEEPIGPDYAVTAANNYFWRRCMSIYGGSNEIQRNIIAKAMLGL